MALELQSSLRGVAPGHSGEHVVSSSRVLLSCGVDLYSLCAVLNIDLLTEQLIDPSSRGRHAIAETEVALDCVTVAAPRSILHFDSARELLCS